MHMKTKTHAVLLALAAWLCAGGAGAAETVPAGAPDHGARTFWDAAAWTQPPRTFPVEVPCSNVPPSVTENRSAAQRPSSSPSTSTS